MPGNEAMYKGQNLVSKNQCLELFFFIEDMILDLSGQTSPCLCQRVLSFQLTEALSYSGYLHNTWSLQHNSKH